MQRRRDRRRVRLQVTGMGCRRCVREVTARMRDVLGVETVQADPVTGVLVLVGSMSPAEVLGALQGSHFVAQVLDVGPAS